MRKAINGLSAIVECAGLGDLFSPTLFVFAGKRRDVLKILYFDKSGFCLWQKRLERERFPWPKMSPDRIVTISTEQLEWLLSGYDIWKMKPFAELKFENVC
jgi:transposase